MHGEQKFPRMFSTGCQPTDRCRASWTASRGFCTLSSPSVLFGPRSCANSDLVQSVARDRLVLTHPRIGRLRLDCCYSGTTKMMPDPLLVDSAAPNQSMKPTAPFRIKSSMFATTPCRGFLFLVRSMTRLFPIALAVFSISYTIAGEIGGYGAGGKADGKQFDFSVTDTAVKATPVWTPDAA